MFIKLRTNKTKSKLMRVASLAALIIMLPVTTIQASAYCPESYLFAFGPGSDSWILTLKSDTGEETQLVSSTFGTINNLYDLDYGWSSNDIYLTGNLPPDSFYNGGHDETLNNYVIFDLTDISAESISEADLQVFNRDGGFKSCYDTETYTLYDVTTPILDLTSGTVDTAVHNDLGTGTSYGYVTVSADDNGEYITIPVNNAGTNALKAAAGGMIAIGGTLEIASNTPPIADSGEPYLVAVGQSFEFDGSGSSDSDGDALSETWTAEGGTTDGNVYTAGDVPGIYNVTLVVNDGNVNSDLDTTTVVVYDLAGGFVTGSGTISFEQDENGMNIPCEGNCTSSANFGFVSKYNKGNSVPTGNTYFNFQDGNLNFSSNDYQWLVVDGEDATLKGSGNNNGIGDYGFMLSVGDYGNTSGDTLHIIIWNKGDNDTVVYDNGVDQVISNGQIKIHTKK